MPPKTDAAIDTSTRSRITRAAVDLWFERGYHGASLRDIAKVVGVQMSTLYHYHPGKQSLLVELMSATTDELTEYVTAAIYAARTPRDKLVAGVKAHVMYHADRRKEIFITDSELRSLEPIGHELIIGKRDAYTQMFAAVMKQGAEEGVFVPRDISVTMSAMFGMINSVPLWYRPDGRLALSQIADYIAEIVLDGVGVHERSPRKR